MHWYEIQSEERLQICLQYLRLPTVAITKFLTIPRILNVVSNDSENLPLYLFQKRHKRKLYKGFRTVMKL